MKNPSKIGKNLLIAYIISILIASTLMTSVNAQTYYLAFFDSFDDYVEKVYSGTDGPGMWYQSIGGGGAAEYKVAVSGATKSYNLKSTGGIFVKSILAYYVFGYYIGPNDYDIESIMKIVNGEGGLIFRISPDFKKYYLATVYKTSKKLVLWYVNEDEGPGAGPVLGQANIPDTVDVGDWFSLKVTVYKNNITISIEGHKLLSILDNRLPNGGFGLYTYKNGEASFNSFMLIVLTTTEATTTTKTVTSSVTTTSTLTTTSYHTTTITGAETTLTETKTQTITTIIPTTSLFETTITQVSTTGITETITTTKTETMEVTRTAPGPTETITTTVTQGLGPRCLIATAAYGSEIAPQVQALREFRDNFVMNTFAGSNFMTAFNAFYYSWSPYVARAEYDNLMLRDIIKTAIYPLLFSLDVSKNVASWFPAIPELAVLISGLIAAFFIGLIYFAPLVTSIFLVLRWRGRSFSVNLLYPATALAACLLFFILAEALTSSTLMVIASSIIVLSTIAIGTIIPINILSVLCTRRRP